MPYIPPQFDLPQHPDVYLGLENLTEEQKNSLRAIFAQEPVPQKVFNVVVTGAASITLVGAVMALLVFKHIFVLKR